MKTNNTISATLIFLCLFSVLTMTAKARAAGYEPAGSLDWPLWNALQSPMVERTRIWTYLGEIQNRTGAGNALHSGNDFRGKDGDVVKAVAAGNVWYTHHRQSDCQTDLGSANSCRIYILGKPTNSAGEEVADMADADHQYVFYYSHLWYGDMYDSSNTPDGAIITSETRAALEQAKTTGNQPYDIDDWEDGESSSTHISAGQAIALIADFSGWNHLHFGIYDRLDNYNAIAPLTAMKKTNPHTFDAEDPIVYDMFLMTDQTAYPNTTNSTQPEGECGEIPRDQYDIIADAKDRFEREGDIDLGLEGDDWWVPETREGETLSLHEAKYVIRNIGTGVSEEHIWYNFDKMPFECVGDPTEPGYSCPVFSDSNFWNHSIDEAWGYSGAVIPGLPYAETIYSSYSNMANAGSEPHNYLILTNPWGTDNNWDATNTTLYPDGQYQVMVQAYDQSGRMDYFTKFVYLGDGSPCTCGDLPPAIYVRDNLDDVGAIPTETPHWVSRDIVILEPGEGRPASRDTRGIASDDVEIGIPYEVWVRVHRLNCAPTEEIEAKVMALKPTPVLDPDDPESETEYITTGYEAGDSVFVGFDLDDTEYEYIGPFEWTRVNGGHRCLIARVKYTSEDPDDVEGELVQEDNRYTQRNLQEVDGFSSNEFRIVNPHEDPAEIEIEFDARSLPIEQPGAAVTLIVEFNSALYEAWSDVPGTAISTNTAGDIVLSIYGSRVRLPAATLPGFISLNALVELSAPAATSDTFEVYFAEWVDGVLRGGMSFWIQNVIIY